MTTQQQFDVAALCAAIDAGDDDALPILADAFEEARDERATVLRAIHRSGARPAENWTDHGCRWARRWSWYCSLIAGRIGDQDRIPQAVYQRLMSGVRFRDIHRHYPTRSLAYLALAAALAAQQ